MLVGFGLAPGRELPRGGPHDPTSPLDPHDPDNATSVRAVIRASHRRSKPRDWLRVGARLRGDWLRVGATGRHPQARARAGRPALSTLATPTTRPRFGRKYGPLATARSQAPFERGGSPPLVFSSGLCPIEGRAPNRVCSGFRPSGDNAPARRDPKPTRPPRSARREIGSGRARSIIPTKRTSEGHDPVPSRSSRTRQVLADRQSANPYFAPRA
jgi:hypothetical protein